MSAIVFATIDGWSALDDPQYHEALKQIQEENHFRTEKLPDYRKNLLWIKITRHAELRKLKQSLESIRSLQR